MGILKLRVGGLDPGQCPIVDSMNRLGKTIEYGDFQTPENLARDVCALLARQDVRPAALLEPTCGLGRFLFAGLDRFEEVKKAIGADINADYIKRAEAVRRHDRTPTRCLLSKPTSSSPTGKKWLSNFPRQSWCSATCLGSQAPTSARSGKSEPSGEVELPEPQRSECHYRQGELRHLGVDADPLTGGHEPATGCACHTLQVRGRAENPLPRVEKRHPPGAIRNLSDRRRPPLRRCRGCGTARDPFSTGRHTTKKRRCSVV